VSYASLRNLNSLRCGVGKGRFRKAHAPAGGLLRQPAGAFTRAYGQGKGEKVTPLRIPGLPHNQKKKRFFAFIVTPRWEISGTIGPRGMRSITHSEAQDRMTNGGEVVPAGTEQVAVRERAE